MCFEKAVVHLNSNNQKIHCSNTIPTYAQNSLHTIIEVNSIFCGVVIKALNWHCLGSSTGEETADSTVVQ